ncbi:uracil-DNA glycosylase [uncultured Desulfobulbus sp.]|uniref:uracil-DNA glycosylase n=1 Tax=uncultured Desulfobulbus sp. TaxID=239745 RepID=UPI0029C61471|nr:uracil-DNA glycosylase [uncultured Desulfobulbus sp.]
MTATEPTMGGDDPTPDTVVPDRSSVLAMAAALRTFLRFHEQMGVESYPLIPELAPWPKKGKATPGPKKSARPALPATPPPLCREQSQPWTKEASGEQLVADRRDIEGCQMCSLAAVRQGLVLGRGAVGSPLLVVGDYSGQESGFSVDTMFGVAEDTMLWNMMRAIGLTEADVYVTNTIKCCPESAELLDVESVHRCRGHLLREIELVRPRIICVMGEWAVRSVLGSEESVFRLRGRFHRYGTDNDATDPLQVAVTFHPRFLLKNEELKKAAWQDLQMIQRRLRAS